MYNKQEMVFVMLKPAAFRRNLVSNILIKILSHGFNIEVLKVIPHPSKEKIAIQYPEKEFIETNRIFSRERIINYCTEGPVMIMVLLKENAIQEMKNLKGCPDPKKAKSDTIRSLIDDTIEEADAEKRALRDLIHSSDYKKETILQIETWF